MKLELADVRRGRSEEQWLSYLRRLDLALATPEMREYLRFLKDSTFDGNLREALQEALNRGDV